jgi:hypothetical protein
MVTSSGSSSRLLISQAMTAAMVALIAPAPRTIQVSEPSKAASVRSDRAQDNFLYLSRRSEC